MAVLKTCVCACGVCVCGMCAHISAYACGVCVCVACVHISAYVCGECVSVHACVVCVWCVCACVHTCVVLSIVCVCVCVPMYMRASALMTLAPICHDTLHPSGINVKVWMQVFNHRKHYRVLRASFRKTVFGQGVFAFTAE